MRHNRPVFSVPIDAKERPSAPAFLFACNFLACRIKCTQDHLTIWVENSDPARAFLEEVSHAATSSRPGAAAGPADGERSCSSLVDRGADPAPSRPGRRRARAGPHHAEDYPLARHRHRPLPQGTAPRGTGLLKPPLAILSASSSCPPAMNARELLAVAVDPSLILRAQGMTPDPWQRDLLLS